MAASFPGSIKTFTPVVNGNTIQATDINDPYDEITAIEGYTIGGFSRGGPLDKYMTADPGFSSAFGVGATRITYDAGNDRLTVAPQAGDADSGIYTTLPSALQITPTPTAVIELAMEFTVQAIDNLASFEIYAGLFDHANPATAHLAFTLQTTGGGALGDHGMSIAGSGGITMLPGLSGVKGTRYQIKGSWQLDRILALSVALTNAATGDVVDANSVTPVTDATRRNALLPDFGVWFTNASGGPATLYIYDLYLRVIRL